ncbi:class F sortase [Streptomyces sp. MUM 203J]|uniref:class F sortase n=1 Tax=Streptomyces sp. MUM 203J TaxID=2791990 RepID=UPI001F041B2E|nr:class F sortase [Streptomyces sp. MUM 203J]MCH0539508.1 class F sortase [Streptomyces sp. MUM 203J]
MARRSPRRPRTARLTRRQRRLFRLTRTVVLAWVLVAGGMWWAQDGEPSGPAVAAGSATPAAKASKTAQVPEATPTAKPTPTTKPRPTAKPTSSAKPAPAPSPVKKAEPLPAPLPPSAAKRLAIPAITIEAPVVGLGLDRSGALRSPPVDNPRLVGWYEGGPTPGEKGTAIAVGHRDTRTGPAIFLNLDSLKPGNTVRVTREDGLTAVFTVDRVRTYDKDRFPDREVYGQADRPELRLLTCGGSFRPKGGYAANVVVFAHLTAVLKA